MRIERRSDAVARRAREAAEQTLVAEIMTREVVTVRADLSVESLVDLFLARDLSRVPILDDRGVAVGIVAKTDVLRERQVHGDTVEEEIDDSLPPSRVGRSGFHTHATGAIVSDIMSRQVTSLPETATLARAAEMMATDHLHAIVITARGGGMVGLLSPIDIAAWVAGVQA